MTEPWGKIALSTPRIASTASSATPTPNVDTTDMYVLTALTEAATFGAPTGTPINGQKLVIRVKDDGTARGLTWNAIYAGSALPTTTVVNETLYVVCVYNSAATKWDTAAEWGNGFNVVVFTRDTTIGTGTQAVTGVGFKGSALIALTIQDGTKEVGWGFYGGTTGVGFALQDSGTFTTSGVFYTYEASGKTYSGTIASLDADGFTVSWTKTGLPSGTITCYAFVCR